MRNSNRKPSFVFFVFASVFMLSLSKSVWSATGWLDSNIEKTRPLTSIIEETTDVDQKEPLRFCGIMDFVSDKEIVGHWFNNTVKDKKYYLTERRPQFGIITITPSLRDAQDEGCDVFMRFSGSPIGGIMRAEVMSVYSKRRLLLIEAKGDLGSALSKLGESIYDQLMQGTDLHNQVIAEREAERKQREHSRSLGGGGISKSDLQDIVNAAVQGATEAQGKKQAQSAASIDSDVDKPNFKLTENPNNFAIVIGVEKYSDLPEAQFAERDAEAVKNHLIAMGYPSRNVVHLSGEKAGRTSIEKFLETWLPRNVKEDSKVFFYFSGHGAPDTKTGEAYLVPWDGDANFLENTGYPIKRLYEKLNALKVQQVVVALDTCFSGSGGRSVLAKGTRPLVNRVDTGNVGAGKIIALSASSANEISGTVEDEGHGAFTYYFLKGLNGAAADKNGNVTVKGLYDYLKPNVQDTARRQNRDQTPQLMPSTLNGQSSVKLR